ncbi:MAG TPA: Ig-like domain-containing protein, partial [Gemmatimonadaceae bacterium]|nr:Ig-like domain-containing protein [Gemmatimonadaceae bacterium]
MIRGRARISFLIAALTSACASPGIPPGGPVDTDAPKLLGISPDSGRTGVTPKEVRFRFDELVSERPPSVPTLNALFLISPRDGEARVDWHRSEISVRPRRGWRANTPYTVTMLPGLADLRGNVRNVGATIVFSTGATIPSS